MSDEIMGVARIFIDIKVSMDDIQHWQPERIAAFFQGIALTQRAVSDDNFALDEESALLAAGFKPEHVEEMLGATGTQSDPSALRSGSESHKSGNDRP